MFKSVDEGFAYLESFVNTERGGFKPRNWRLSRMRELLEDFGNPQLACRTIHVAGSKGKGSTACFAAHILSSAGERVGLYSSPHVVTYRERIQVLGGSPSDAIFLDQFSAIHRYVHEKRQTVPEPQLPTTFELLTLLAFLCFRASECTVSVIEVGLGGRLDATSLIRPQCCVITPIEYEHTEYLGTTLRSIAGEKGAIMRDGVPAYSSLQQPEAESTLRRIAELRDAPFRTLRDEIPEINASLTSNGTECRFRLPDGGEIRSHLRMLGRVQANNAALATLAARVVRPDLTPGIISSGLSRAVLPGRSEVLPGNPALLLDGAHTPQSIKLLAETVSEICPVRERRTLIFGSVAGKRYQEMLQALVPLFSRVIICRPGTFKPSDPELLMNAVSDLGVPPLREDDGKRALALAGSDPATKLIVATGSFYLVGKIRAAAQPTDTHTQALS